MAVALQCDREIALSSYFHQINNLPIKVGWVGSGCSVATEPTAELTHLHNITQVHLFSILLLFQNVMLVSFYPSYLV